MGKHFLIIDIFLPFRYDEHSCIRNILGENIKAAKEIVFAEPMLWLQPCSDVRFIPCGHLAFPFLRQRRQRSRGREADGGNGSGKNQK